MAGPSQEADLKGFVENLYRPKPPSEDEQELKGFVENLYAPTPEPKKEVPVGDRVKQGLLITGGVIGGALGGRALFRVFRRAFPGMTPKQSALDSLKSSMKADGMDLKTEFQNYIQKTSHSDRPVSFADYLASEAPRANQTMRTLNEFIDKSEQSVPMARKLTERTAGQRDRILKSLAEDLGVDQKGLALTLEDMKKAQLKNAKPLYEQAFKDQRSIVDTRLHDVMDRHSTIMEAALENAKEAFKFDPKKRVEDMTRAANAAGGTHRKDAWRYLDVDGVPSFLQVGAPKAGLQTYIAPNLEQLDRMKRALWKLAEKRAKEGAGDVGAIHEARRELTEVLDQIAPPAYKQARAIYAGDAEMTEAAEMGGKLLRMSPDEVRAKLAGMSPSQRAALAQGFYGKMQDASQQALIRQIVSNPVKYQKEREILGAVFPDKTRLDAFLSDLDAERAMLAGKSAYYGVGTQTASPGVMDVLGAVVSPKATATQAAFGRGPWASSMPWTRHPRVTAGSAKAGTELAFADPVLGPQTSHPAFADIMRQYEPGMAKWFDMPGSVAFPAAGAPAGGLAAAAMTNVGTPRVPEHRGALSNIPFEEYPYP